jgi:glucose-1-phosphate thymidylyltransferase
MLTGIRDILIISTLHDLPLFQRLFGTGEQWGVRFAYQAQSEPKGIADALLIAERFIEDTPCCMVLGDNIFYGSFFHEALRGIGEEDATVFAYRVSDPHRFGVVEFDKDLKAVSIEEKPEKPRSKFAVPGLYFYDQGASELARTLTPSRRGELEITDLNRLYLNEGRLNVRVIGRGSAWFDAGTHKSLLEAGNFIAAVEQRQGMRPACPEEIAMRQNWIDINQYRQLIDDMGENSYKNYLQELLETDFAAF